VYDLENDPGETENLYRQHPEWVEQLKTLFGWMGLSIMGQGICSGRKTKNHEDNALLSHISG
jgi:hypothetical protein